MSPAEAYDPKYRPNPGSKLLLASTVPGHPPVEAVLEGYRPGKVRGLNGRHNNGHRNILVRVNGALLHASTLAIVQITWKAPKPRKRATRTPAQRKARNARQRDARTGRRGPKKGTPIKHLQPTVLDAEGGDGWSETDPGALWLHGQSVLEMYDAAYEDERGDLPATLPPHPGIDAVVRQERRQMRRYLGAVPVPRASR